MYTQTYIYPGSSFGMFICARGPFDTLIGYIGCLQNYLEHYSDIRALSAFCGLKELFWLPYIFVYHVIYIEVDTYIYILYI